MSPAEMLARLPGELVTRVRLLIASGWPLEAERLVAEELGSGQDAKTLVAWLVKRSIVG